jgi:hypothetical protein
VWGLWKNQGRFTRWDRHTAEQCYYNKKHLDYWQPKIDQAALIDWHAAGRALKRLPLYQQFWFPKWIRGVVPTGGRLLMMNVDTDGLCPLCPLLESHRYHIPRCGSDSATAKWDQFLLSFDEYLVEQCTHPTIRRGLISLLTQWYSHTPWTPPATTDPLVARAFADQLQLGWERIGDGMIAQSWAPAQQQYYDSLHRKTTGTRWSSRIISRIWQMIWDLWMNRQKALQDPTSLALARRNTALSEAISSHYLGFQTLTENQDPDLNPLLNRWFSRPLPILLAETIAAKEQWLAMVISILAL